MSRPIFRSSLLAVDLNSSVQQIVTPFARGPLEFLKYILTIKVDKLINPFMGKEVCREREVIAQGMEHSVLRPLSRKPDIVLKVPRPFDYLTMLGQNRAAVLRQERAEALALLEGTDVKIPETFIYGNEKKIAGVFTTNGYVIGQRYVEEDKSVSDIATHLADQGLHTLVDEYVHEPRNFVSHGGIVYWVDPTKGTIGRFLESRKLMKVETYRKIRRRLSKVIRFFGL